MGGAGASTVPTDRVRRWGGELNPGGAKSKEGAFPVVYTLVDVAEAEVVQAAAVVAGGCETAANMAGGALEDSSSICRRMPSRVCRSPSSTYLWRQCWYHKGETTQRKEGSSSPLLPGYEL